MNQEKLDAISKHIKWLGRTNEEAGGDMILRALPRLALAIGKAITNPIVDSAKSMAKAGDYMLGKDNNLSTTELQGALANALLMGAPGGGTGPANILRKPAIKSMGRQLKSTEQIIKKEIKRAERVIKNNPTNQFAQERLLRLKDQQVRHKESIKGFMKAVRMAPQKELDRIDDIIVEAGTSRTTRGSLAGYYQQNASQPTVEAAIKQGKQPYKQTMWLNSLPKDPNNPAAPFNPFSTFFHELTHGGQRRFDPHNEALMREIMVQDLKIKDAAMGYRNSPLEKQANVTAEILTEMEGKLKGLNIPLGSKVRFSDKAYDTAFAQGLASAIEKAGENFTSTYSSRLAVHKPSKYNTVLPIPKSKQGVAPVTKPNARTGLTTSVTPTKTQFYMVGGKRLGTAGIKLDGAFAKNKRYTQKRRAELIAIVKEVKEGKSATAGIMKMAKLLERLQPGLPKHKYQALALPLIRNLEAYR